MSEKLTKVIVDCASGKQTILPLTPAEIAHRDQLLAASLEEKAKREADEKKLADLKISARTKLVKGEKLTDEEAAAIVI